MGVTYLPFPELIRTSEIITLHCPLTPETRHLIGSREVDLMKPGRMLPNTGRGAVLDTRAVIPNVIITGHQGFFTAEALADITQTTMDIIRRSPTASTAPLRPAFPP